MAKLRYVVRCGILLLSGPCFIFQVGLSQEQSTVSGRVIAEDGSGVSGATVSVLPLEVGVSGGLPYALTDANGGFTLASPAFGKTRLVAVKVDDGYPDTRFAIFAPLKEETTEVLLNPSTHLHDVTIRLPSKDGTIQGLVVDGATGEIVKHCRLHLERWNEPQVFEDTDCQNGGFDFSLPDREIKITVTAPGYLPMTVAEPGNNMQYLKLKSGERKTITVKLHARPQL